MPSTIEQELQNAEVSVEFEDAREERLIREAVQGRDVQDWLSSPVGRFVSGAAAQDQQEIEQQLARIRPNTRFRRRRIEDLQMRHMAISNAISWLSEAIQIGQNAERELNQPKE